MQTKFFRSFFLNLILCGSAVIFFAVIMELWFRLAAPQIPIRSPLMYAPHSHLRYIPNPGTSWRYRTTEFDTRVTINSHGMRDYERPLEKPKRTFRILCLGDSFTLGAEVELEQCYPKVLERLLNERAAAQGDSIRYEVLNGGVGGYGTSQELLFLKEFGLRHKPDLVLVQFYANDIRDNIAFQDFWVTIQPDSAVSPLTHDVPAPQAHDVPASIQYASIWGEPTDWPATIKTFLVEHSHLYHFVRARSNIIISVLGMRQLTAFDDFMVMAPDPSPEIEMGWDLTRALYLRMRDLLLDHQAGLAVIVVPNKAQVVRNWRYDAWVEEQQLDMTKPARILQAFGNQHRTPVFDLQPDLQKAGATQSLYFDWDGHWNANGCRAAAEALARFLLEQKLIPLEPDPEPAR
jgi:lysophospholipase L1-like esterase